METFKKLETLGLFDWLEKEHNLKDTDMTPEYLDKLPSSDIHITVLSAAALRWFRETHKLHEWIPYNSLTNKFRLQEIEMDYEKVYDGEEEFVNKEDAILFALNIMSGIVEQQEPCTIKIIIK